MFLKSILDSSKFEILFSKRLTTLMYAVFGVLIMFWWGSACLQFFNAYVSLHEFDASLAGFILVTIVFFLPLVILGSFMLSVLIQRFRLSMWFKSLVHYPVYNSIMGPAEAGLLIDYEFSNEEVLATLLNLHFRNNIIISNHDGNFSLQLISVDGMTAYERMLTDRLMPHRTVTLSTLNDLRLVNAGHAAHGVLSSQIHNTNSYSRNSTVHENVNNAVKAIFYLGGGVGIANAIGYVFNYDEVMAINFPRYPVYPVEIVLLLLVTLAAAAVIATGFRGSFSSSQTDGPESNYIQARGFKQYLDIVFKDRMNETNITSQDVNTVKFVLPYLVAYKILPLTPELLATAINFSNQERN